MSDTTEALRDIAANHGWPVCGEAADEIEVLEKAYELLFKENAELKAAPTAPAAGPQQAEAVAWCALTPSGRIAYFDGKPMVMPGPVGNEHHPVALVVRHPAPAFERGVAEEQEPLYLVMAGGDAFHSEIVPESKLDDAYLLTQWSGLDNIDPEQRAEALEHFHDDDSWTHEQVTGHGPRVKFSLSFEDGWVEVVRLPSAALTATGAAQGDGASARIAQLEAELNDKTAELEEARRAPWPKWAEQILKLVREFSGYDGYDDSSEGIDLPEEVRECLEEFASQIRRLSTTTTAQQEAPAAQGDGAGDVTSILLDVVPGPDGMGHEVYAKNVEDVKRKLTELGDKIEALQSRPSQQEAPAGAAQGDGAKTDLHEALRVEQKLSEHLRKLNAKLLDKIAQQEAPAAQPLTDAARDVLAERQRQIEVEGWTPEHDDEHRTGGMSIAAACYAAWSLPSRPASETVAALWPWTGWAKEWFKPKDTRHNLIRAGALILAEIERLDRAHGIQPAATKGTT